MFSLNGGKIYSVSVFHTSQTFAHDLWWCETFRVKLQNWNCGQGVARLIKQHFLFEYLSHIPFGWNTNNRKVCQFHIILQWFLILVRTSTLYKKGNGIFYMYILHVVLGTKIEKQPLYLVKRIFAIYPAIVNFNLTFFRYQSTAIQFFQSKEGGGPV